MSNLELSSVVHRNPQQLSVDMDGETVMLSIENNSYFGLNSIGSEIWNSIETPVSISEICRNVEEKFSVDPKECEVDVLELLTELLESNLVVKAA